MFWLFLVIAIGVGILLYALLHDSPADRLRKAEAAIQVGKYPEATEQINWLLEHENRSAPAMLARLYLTKAQVAMQKGAANQAVQELDLLYLVRSQHAAADLVLLTAVEKDSDDVLVGSIEAQAKPAEMVRNWTEALRFYEAGLKRAVGVATLANGSCVGKLQNRVTNCYEQLLRADLQPRLNDAINLLPQGKFDEAEQSLAAANQALRGPFALLQEHAAAKLRLLVLSQGNYLHKPFDSAGLVFVGPCRARIAS